MIKNYTPKKKIIKPLEQKPTQQTINTILAYSKATKVYKQECLGFLEINKN